jgi:hypothetical protein
VRPISRKQHALAGYLFAAGEAALPYVLEMGAAPRRLLRASALNGLLLSALTRYELGLVKLVPLRAHLAADGAVAALVLGAAGFLGEEPPRVRAVLAALGLSGGLVAALTDPDRA